MQIDWFTVLAQIVNFIILLYLLKRFLYGPIINMMDRREQNIAGRLQQAEERRREAEHEAEKYRQQRKELEEKRDEEMTAIQQEVADRRKELLEEAQKDIQQKKQNWQDALQREQENFIQEFRQRIGQEAGKIARRALQDLADVQVEQRMSEQFIRHLQNLDPEEKSEILQAIQRSDGQIAIRSAFDLPQDSRQAVEEAIRKYVLDDDTLNSRFETVPDLISGIEIYAHGQQIAWTIKDYLADLDAQIRESFAEETRAQREASYDT